MVDERADDRDIVVEYRNGTMTEGPLPRTFWGRITRPVLMVANDWREARQREWMPQELMEPAESTVLRPINWDQ